MSAVHMTYLQIEVRGLAQDHPTVAVGLSPEEAVEYATKTRIVNADGER